MVDRRVAENLMLSTLDALANNGANRNEKASGCFFVSKPSTSARHWKAKVVSKHCLVTFNIQPMEPRYFAAYKDDGATCEAIWTTDFYKAKWFSAEEARIEATLLIVICPGYVVDSWQISGAK